MTKRSKTTKIKRLYSQLKKTTNPEEMRRLGLKIQTLENTAKK